MEPSADQAEEALTALGDESWFSIESFGGNCPVQAEGTVCGLPFYFRSRHDRWTFEVGARPWEPSSEPDATSEFCGQGPLLVDIAAGYGCDHDAGWMPDDVARATLRRCLLIARESVRATVPAVIETALRTLFGVDLERVVRATFLVAGLRALHGTAFNGGENP